MLISICFLVVFTSGIRIGRVVVFVSKINVMIEQIIDWLLWLVREIGYPGVALAMFIESFFAPIPSEAIMPLA